MKFKIFFLSTLLITNYCFAQTYFELSIGLSNQTQIRKVFDDFYLNNLKITTKTNLYSAGTTNATDLKYLIHTGIIFNKNYKIQLGFGIGQIKNEIKGDSTSVTNGPFIHEEYSQHITEWNLSLSRVIYFDKFSLSVGLEIPLIIMGEFKYISEDKLGLLLTYTWNGSSYFHEYINETLSTPGGTVFGINNKISLKYSFLNSLYVFVGGKFGLLKTDVGGIAKYSYNYSNLNNYGYAGTIDFTHYKNTYISPPTMEFGIGFTFGKTVQ